ncbi:MAG TPA: hypothetical protein VJ739_09420 [Gemmataceae bacterium]|nr:hypothetical protein [Gemmataceae bacterium]
MADKDQAPKQPPIAGMRPGGPNNPARGYTPGTNYVGEHMGGESANDQAGGDIDRPDITGRGSETDIARHGDKGQGEPDTFLAGPSSGGTAPE